MSRWRGAALVFVLGCGTLLKPPDPDRRLSVQTAGTTFDSDRGYRFVVLPEDNANVIRIDVRYPVGAIDDPVGKEGLAHLVEHLLTEVEVTRDGVKTSLEAELGRVGLSFNARTSADYTVYEALAMPSALEDLMRVEAERLTAGCAGISRGLFEREREVVQNELREHDGDDRLRRQIHEEIYPAGHPYRRVDSSDTVATITYEDVCAFLVGPYRRGTVIVAISGAVDVPAVKAAVSRQFTRVPQRIQVPAPVVPRVEPRPGTVRLRAAVDEPMLLVTWPLPPMSTTEYRLLEIAWGKIALHLEGYAFLYHWGHSGDTTLFGGPRAPVLGVSIVLDSVDKLDDAKARLEGSVRDALYQVARPGEERDSPEWVRQYEAKVESLLARLETLSGRNDLFSDIQHYEPTSSVKAHIDELVTSTPGATRELAERWLSPKRARFLLIEPSGASDVGHAGAFDVLVEQHSVQVDRASADKPLPAPPRSLWPKPERYTLDNGLAVVLWPYGATPLVRGRLVVDAGAIDDPFGAEGVSQLVGASSVFADTMVFDDRSLANRVDDLVRTVASELRLPGYGLEDEQRDYLLARLDRPRVRERAAYELDVLVALYGEGHPYARNAMTIGGVMSLSNDSVQEWARRYITPRNTTLVFAGAFDAALVRKHVAYAVDHVAAGSRTRDIKVDPRTTPAFIAGTTDKASSTVELDVHYIGGRGIDDDHPKRLVLEAVLGAQLAELRAKRAITYGVAASYEPRRAGGMWTIRGQVDAARAGEAGAAIIGILDNMRFSPETYRGAFVLARQKVMESLLVRSNSAIDVAESLVVLARFGLEDAYFDTVAREVASMTLVDFHAFLGKELAVSRQVFGAFGNAEPVKAAVAAARAVKPVAAPSPIVDPFQ